MSMLIPLAIGLIIGGLLMCYLRGSVSGVLSTIIYYTGIVVIILGLVLLLAPVVVWISNQLQAMFGLNR